MSNHDFNHYHGWRASRTRKLDQIFGREYFRGKSVLECGAGTGLIGKFLREQWGAKVSFTEGRPELIERIERNNRHTEIYLIDHDHPWHIPRRFDVIIHWGLLYHLRAWRNELTYAINCMDLGGVMLLESEVLDSDKDEEIEQVEKREDDQSLSGMAVRASAIRIEKALRDLNLEFKRYDDPDLNSEFHCYDWKVANSMTAGGEHRRFWVIS
jgi:hypothetical protein